MRLSLLWRRPMAIGFNEMGPVVTYDYGDYEQVSDWQMKLILCFKVLK